MKRLPTLVTIEDRQPMSPLVQEAFMSCFWMERSKPQTVSPDFLPAALASRYSQELAEDFPVKILMARLPAGQQYSPDAVALAGMIADNPGKAVAWAYTVFERGRELGRAYTVSDMAEDFPLGFPTDAGFHAYWDGQKGFAQEPPVKCDNMLDQKSAWTIPEEATP